MIIEKEYISLLEFLNAWYDGIGTVDDTLFGGTDGIVVGGTWTYQSLYKFLTINETTPSSYNTVLIQYPFIKLESGVYSSTPVVDKLFDSIRQRFINSLLVYPVDQNGDFVKGFINNFLSILINTYNKYSLIIGKYETLKDGILDGITVTVDEDGTVDSTQRFNDTPQSYDEDGETFIDADYTSNVNIGNASNSRNVTTVDDRELLVERLNKVQNQLNDLYLSWSNEFTRLFK